MNNLCFLTNLTSSEIAAWAQAIFAGAAILAAGYIANWQARKQYEGARALQESDRLQAQRRLVSATARIARNALVVAQMTAKEIDTRDKIGKIVDQQNYIDREELARLSEVIKEIPLHALPTAEIVSLAMSLTSTLRQFDSQIGDAIEKYREMDPNDFGRFFRNIAQLIESLNGTCDDLDVELTKLDQIQ
jgi:hypothetical protein